MCKKKPLPQITGHISPTDRDGLYGKFFDMDGKEVCEIRYVIDSLRPYSRLIVDNIHTHESHRRKGYATSALHFIGQEHGIPIVPHKINGDEARDFWRNARRTLYPHGIRVWREISFSDRAKEIREHDAKTFWETNS